MLNPDLPPLSPPKVPLGYLVAGVALWIVALAALLFGAPAEVAPERYVATAPLDPCVAREFPWVVDR
jgi:hypothetical protein